MKYSKALKSALKIYAVFAISNVLYKIIRVYLRLKYVKKLWKDLKGEDSDVTLKKLRKYGNRLLEFFSDPVVKHANEGLIKAPMPAPWLVATSSKTVEWLFKDEFFNATRPGEQLEPMRLVSLFMGPKGIFALRHGHNYPEQHKLWKDQRKIASKIFTKTNFMNSFHQTFTENADKLVKKLQQQQGEVVDLQGAFFSFTMNNIEKLFLGKENKSYKLGAKSLFATNFDMVSAKLYSMIVAYRGYWVINKFLLPYPFGALNMKSKMNESIFMNVVYYFSSYYASFKQGIKEIDEEVISYIKETRNDPDINHRQDLIALFIKADTDGKFSDKILRDIIISFTLAGRDTTATTLSWLFFELMKNETVQRKLRDEVDRILKGKVPVLDDLDHDMPYLNGVLYETLRLHPPVPNTTVVIQRDTKYGEVSVPAGTNITVSPIGMGKNEDTYANPDEFIPERWIPFVKPTAFEFPVFLAGHRVCVGKDFAIFQAKLLTVMLLQKYSFRMRQKDIDNVTYCLGITVAIANDLNRQRGTLNCSVTRRGS